jgi:hypothetical protein
LCPNCRAVTDLEAEIEEAESDWEEDLKEAIEASKTESAEKKLAAGGIGAKETPGTVDADGDLSMADASHAPPDRPAPLPPTLEPIAVGAEYVTRASSLSPEVPSQQPNGIMATAALPIPGRNVSPGTRRYDLMTNGTTEGPQTPRNDAGPFVLDGAGAITAQASVNGAQQPSRMGA